MGNMGYTWTIRSLMVLPPGAPLSRMSRYARIWATSTATLSHSSALDSRYGELEYGTVSHQPYAVRQLTQNYRFEACTSSNGVGVQNFLSPRSQTTSILMWHATLRLFLKLEQNPVNTTVVASNTEKATVFPPNPQPKRPRHQLRMAVSTYFPLSSRPSRVRFTYTRSTPLCSGVFVIHVYLSVETNVVLVLVPVRLDSKN